VNTFAVGYADHVDPDRFEAQAPLTPMTGLAHQDGLWSLDADGYLTASQSSDYFASAPLSSSWMPCAWSSTQPAWI
jgi:hypothetical protein